MFNRNKRRSPSELDVARHNLQAAQNREKLNDENAILDRSLAELNVASLEAASRRNRNGGQR